MGRYADSIERWLAHFDASCFHFVSLDELSQDSGRVLREIEAKLQARGACVDVGVPVTDVAAPKLNEGAPLPAHLEPDEALLRELAAYYRPHNERLFALIGRDLNWHADKRFWWYRD